MPPIVPACLSGLSYHACKPGDEAWVGYERRRGNPHFRVWRLVCAVPGGVGEVKQAISNIVQLPIDLIVISNSELSAMRTGVFPGRWRASGVKLSAVSDLVPSSAVRPDYRCCSD